jgi:SAM-dependent methyltransferase
VASLQKKFARNEFFQLDIGAPLALREQFDVISAMDVLFHIIDDRRYEAAIFNVHSLLNPGGWFILTDNFLHATADRAVHQVSRSLNEVTSILERTGFQIIRRKPMFVLMNYPIDAKRQIWKSSWKILMYPARKNAFFAYLLGAGLYPIESALTRLFHEGPSTELMICRKRDPGTPGRSYAY